MTLLLNFPGPVPRAGRLRQALPLPTDGGRVRAGAVGGGAAILLVRRVNSIAGPRQDLAQEEQLHLGAHRRGQD